MNKLITDIGELAGKTIKNVAPLDGDVGLLFSDGTYAVLHAYDEYREIYLRDKLTPFELRDLGAITEEEFDAMFEDKT